MSCRERLDTTKMRRLRADGQGDVFLDLDGKGAGRSAYLCSDQNCLAQGLSVQKLNRALRRPIREDSVNLLRQELLCQPR
ncbi:MAG: YlxR family protein [Armatimonadetes bacterium]|nr:YlxR family protein [Armatimonadota bacterium]